MQTPTGPRFQRSGYIRSPNKHNRRTCSAPAANQPEPASVRAAKARHAVLTNELNQLKQREKQRALLPLAKRAVLLPQAEQKELVLWLHLEAAQPGVPPIELRWPADGHLEQCIQSICSLHGWIEPPTRVRAVYDFRGTLLYPCSLHGADAVAGMVFKHNQTVVASAWAPHAKPAPHFASSRGRSGPRVSSSRLVGWQ